MKWGGVDSAVGPRSLVETKSLRQLPEEDEVVVTALPENPYAKTFHGLLCDL